MKSWHAFRVVVVLSAWVTWPLAALEPVSGPPPLPEKIRQAMQDRHYAEAIAAIEEALQAKVEPQDYLVYLKGWALCLDSQFDAAAATFGQLEQQYPQSVWTSRARLAKAVALARKGDFHSAEMIYQAEAHRLLSDERKQGLADIYLSYADAYFHPTNADKKPDYAQALEFYRKALELSPPSEKRAEIHLRIAECLQQTGNFREAADFYLKFSQDYPKSPLDVEARYRAGECRLALHEPQQARRIWQDLLAMAADSPSERIAEAQFHLAETWGMPAPPTADELTLGVAALEAFLERFPDHKQAGPAFLSLAQGYALHKRYDDVVRVLTRFLQQERYQQRPELPEARWLLGQAYQLQKKYAETLAAWREYLSKYPSAPRWSTIQQEVVNTEYLIGLEKHDAQAYDEAVQLWTDFLARYPLDERAPEILVQFGRMHHAQKRWEAALAEWQRVVSKYPNTRWAEDAQWLIAQTLEEPLGQFEKALEEYRKIQSGSHQCEALQAIDRLEEKSLVVSTERVFRSDETPKIKLRTRNLEAVTVRIYRVDLETYFRKMHTADDITRLDIALIDPDRSWEFQVPGYAKYRQLENEVEVPLPDEQHAGVLAVTVSSKTQEATTLVLQSDLELIAKVSRNGAFVLAENLRTGKPWPGVRLLFSNHQQVFAEATTDAQGVLQQNWEALKSTSDVAVFAAVDAHVASTDVLMKVTRVAEPLTDKGYLFTDRPAYQAGQRVHVRGCLRQVEQDTYTVTPNRPYTLTVLDANNREIWRKDLTLGPFGSLQAEFPLPSTSPPGTYRILAQDQEGHSYPGSFVVHPFQLEPVRLSVDTPRRVYYRGEEIQGTIRASYTYGAPVVGHEVSYQLAGDRVYRATTDAQGEVAFKLPTREFAETQTLPLVVLLPGDDLATTANFVLAQKAFSIELNTQRSVFLAGETFEVTAAVRDAEGKPLAQACTLKVLEETRLAGNIAQRPVEEHPLQTSEDGKARLTLKLDKGGTYFLRAEAIDRFQNPVSKELAVQISDPEDSRRLRLLADQHDFRVGDTAAVRVHWREQPALALVTVEDARVLDYQLVELKQGDNSLSIPVRAAMAPGFELSVSVMTDVRTKPVDPAKPAARFHEVSSPFTAQRQLKVELSAKRKDGTEGPIRPSEEVAVSVVTTDPQGKPVSAEVSLALVQQSLVEHFGWPMRPMEEFFRGTPPAHLIHTASSVIFDCHAETKPINPRLLAEEDRQELARSEELSRQAAVTASGGNGFFGGGMGGFGEAPSAAAQPAVPASPPAAPQEVESNRGPQAEPNLAAEAQKKHRPMPAQLGADLGQETGYWNPSIVTDENGQATVTFSLPRLSTAWTLVAKGITTDTLVGETSQAIVAQKPLFGQLRLPAAFTNGDQAEIGVTIHNDLVEQGSVEVTLKTTIGDRTVEERKTIEAKRGIQELSFKTPLATADGQPRGQARFELTVVAGNQQDVVQQTVPLLPYGLPVFATASGSATSDTAVWVEPPQETTLEAPSLRIVLGPTVEQSLLEILSDTASPWCGGELLVAGTAVERATSDLMAAVALGKLLGRTREAGSPLAPVLDGKVRAALALLITSQNAEGGWSWTGQDGKSHRFTTARAVWALSLARAAGYRVPDEAFHKAVLLLKNELTTADAGDFESRAILLHALAAAGQGDFALANRLYRDRPRLSNAALAYLALAFAEMDRKPIAAELLELLAKRNLEAPPTADSQVAADLPWNHAVVELRALATLAAERAELPAAQIQESVDWLLAHRTGSRWTPDKATGPATLALVNWFAQNRFEGERYRLAITVNDAPAQVLDIDPAAGTQVVEVPADQLKPGKQQIRFQLTGRGRYSYQCVLSGYVPTERLPKSTVPWRVERIYQPAPRELDGHEIPRGFSVVQGPTTSFGNPLAQLPVGKRGQVELRVVRDDAEKTTPDKPWEYLVLSEPLPCGTRVLEGSIHGGFDRYELRPGAIVFYLGDRKLIEPIRFEISGYLPGVYRAVPTMLRNAYRPEQLALSTPQELTILPRGTESSDPYRLTPDERYELGIRLAAKGEKKEAEEHLRTLAETWPLKATVYEKTIKTLLELHLDLGPVEQVVHDFEIVKEKWPDQEIPFHRIVQVGAAYEAMQEYERAYLVFRATLEGSFLRDSGVAGFLDQKGEFLKSVDILERLLREYPPEPYLARAQFGLSQRILAKAAEAATDPKLREQKVNRIDLTRRSWGLIERLLTEFPDDPAADRAAFAAANTLLEIEDFAQAADACRRYAERYPDSPLLDSFWYIIGYSQFASGQTKEALEMCRKVSEAQVADPETGQTKESPNKWQAIYILGQIYHSLGQAADAIREYHRVEDRFPDAKQAAASFLRKTLTLPEVSTFKPGEAVALDLKYRNLTTCDVKIYRVDLMKYALLEQNLGSVAEINLAGIRPQLESNAALAESADYRERTHRLTLALDKEGAYLVVARGENRYASGLVLVTPLALEVEPDFQAQQVRVTVKDALTDACVNKAQIRVMGSGNDGVVSGASDLRGVFVAEAIRGLPTVIAEAGPGRYAFFRSPGTVLHRPLPTPIRAEANGPASSEPASTQEDSLRWAFLSPAERHIREVLLQPTTLDFREIPLTEAAATIKAQHQIEVQVETRALEEQGLVPELPVTLNVQGIPLRSALRHLLQPLSLTYMLRNDVLLITTPEVAAENLVTEVYSVDDLVRTRTPTGEWVADYASLIQLITSSVQPSTWEEVGGTGTLTPLDTRACLVISQTEEVHEEVADLFRSLRKIPMPREVLPARLPEAAPAFSPNGSGMGGMMGGMGGGTFGAPSPAVQGLPLSPSKPGRAANANLLGGLKQSQEQFQREQVEQLQGMYQSGMGMGGMGGGINAGAANQPAGK